MTSESERTARRLVIPEAVQSAIAKLLAVENWLEAGGTRGSLVVPEREFVVEVAAVKAAEEKLDGRFSDEALAIFAAGLKVLGERYEMLPELAVKHTAAARREGVPKSLIAIGKDRGRSFLCLPASPSLGERPRLVIAVNGGASIRREPLESWLVDRIEDALDDLELSPNQLRSLNADEILTAFVPHLKGGASASGAADGGRRVEHKKFGGGTVVREVLGGPEPKLEIVFDSGERRVLLARFVAASA